MSDRRPDTGGVATRALVFRRGAFEAVVLPAPSTRAMLSAGDLFPASAGDALSVSASDALPVSAGDALPVSAGDALPVSAGDALRASAVGVLPASADAVVLPGFVNAHSHAFQRVLRGRVEGAGGDFWSWRDRMYHAALALEPDDVRIASRAAFLEMLLAGFTSVIEFHYLHHDPRGRPYGDPNELAWAVLEAAGDVGIRVCLLPAAYARAGAGRRLEPAQLRFIDPSPEIFLSRAEAVRSRIASGGEGHASGIAPHSVRALPVEWLHELANWAAAAEVPVHMHVAEQRAEVESCLAEHGKRPVELLADLGLLGERFTAVHAVHVTVAEISALAGSGAGVCACPSTEANLADGFVPAAALLAAGVPLCLGTDSHASIDPFAEMRELDYRERLRSGSRAGAATAEALLQAATYGGAERGGWDVENGPREGGDRVVREGTGGEVSGVGGIGGAGPDFVVLDASDTSLAGADAASLASHLLVAGGPRLVRDVYVGGRRIVEGGRHPREDRVRADFAALQRRLWGEA